jgi:hypothetical protein
MRQRSAALDADPLFGVLKLSAGVIVLLLVLLFAGERQNTR